jgi:hypothetical protein
MSAEHGARASALSMLSLTSTSQDP